jgi:hypothetical protein
MCGGNIFEKFVARPKGQIQSGNDGRDEGAPGYSGGFSLNTCERGEKKHSKKKSQ